MAEAAVHVVNIHEAKTQLSRLVRRAEEGGDTVICRDGRPVARLIPYVAAAAPRRLGGWEGEIVIADDFDALPAEIEAAFRGDAP